MYSTGPSEKQLKELEAAGFSASDVVAEDVEIWPDTWLAYEAFNAMGTQWNYRPCGMGLGPPCGLKYEAVPMAFRMARIPRDKWESLYPDLRVMEQAALEAMSNRE